MVFAPALTKMSHVRRTDHQVCNESVLMQMTVYSLLCIWRFSDHLNNKQTSQEVKYNYINFNK